MDEVKASAFRFVLKVTKNEESCKFMQMMLNIFTQKEKIRNKKKVQVQEPFKAL